MNIMAVGAHLDDIEIGCGGFVADMVLRGHDVRMVSMTLSGYRNLEGTHHRSDEVCWEEGRAAADRIGVGADNLTVLFLENMDVPWGSQAVIAVEREIIAFQPDLVVTHSPSDSHQDHRATAMAVISATRYRPNVLLWEPISAARMPAHPFYGAISWPVSEKAMDLKLAALNAHFTEWKKYGGLLWNDQLQGKALGHGLRGTEQCYEVFDPVRLSLDLRL